MIGLARRRRLSSSTGDGAAGAAPSPARAYRARVLAACSAMHAVNDGLDVGLNPILPLMAADLGLSYSQIGAIKTIFTTGAASLQLPAGIAAEHVGEHLLLALGTGWIALGFLFMAATARFWTLAAAALFAGIGGNAQHPTATAVISRLYEGPGRATAIGTLNFSGDIGKMLAPLVVGLAAAFYGWRGGVVALGIIGIVFALLYRLIVPQTPAGIDPAPHPGERDGQETFSETDGAGGAAGGSVLAAETVSRWGIDRPRAFLALLGIGVLDSAARGAAITFIPFLLGSKGMAPGGFGLYLTVLFTAGAAGKFICGPLAARFGNVATIVVTEVVTAAGLAALVPASTLLILVLMVPLGFALNGTSSVLYASVADLVHHRRRGRGYGIYYTGIEGASAAAPILYGLLADRAGLSTTFITMGAATLLIVPVALATSRALKR